MQTMSSPLLNRSMKQESDVFFDTEPPNLHMQRHKKSTLYEANQSFNNSAQYANTSSSPTMATSISEALLQATIHKKCEELTKALRACSIKDLQIQYPIIVQKIFGFQGYSPGWLLEKMPIKQQSVDYSAVMNFLKPDGPLFDVMYKLIADEIILEFPYSAMPAASRRKIEEHLPVSDFYSGRLILTESAQILLLNPFEYFFVLFAFKLVDSSTRTQELYMEPGHYCYPQLLQTYLDYFLPMNGVPNPPPYISNNVKTHTSQSPHRTVSSPFTSPQHKQSGLGLLKSSPSLQIKTSQQNTSDVTDSSLIWRTDTIVQILSEFWFNQTAVEFSLTTLESLQRPPSIHAFNTSLIELYYYDNEYLPSHDLIMSIRMFIKHLHMYTNICQNVILPSYQQNPATLIGNLKSQLIPSIQRSVYGFFKHSFERWPLDSSFRPILETWLTFIQPWRYAKTPSQSQHGEMNIELWHQFMIRYYLFYTSLTEMLLSRFSRIDINSTRISLQLHRVMKVLNTPGISETMREFESLCSRHDYSGHPSSVHHLEGLSKADVIINKIQDLETSSFVYKPLFSSENLIKAQSLLQYAVNSLPKCVPTTPNTDPQNSSFLSLIGLGSLMEFNDGVSSPQAGDQANVETNLSRAIDDMSKLFNLEIPERSQTYLQSEISTCNELPEHIRAEDGSIQLTDLGRYQIMNGLRRFKEIEYSGDSDTQPIRSFEVVSLVRLLHTLSKNFNNKYGVEMERYYNSGGYLGALSRRFLTLPTHNAASPTPTSPSPGKQQPKITLRFMASKQFMFMVIMLYFVLWLCFGHVKTWVLALILFVAYHLLGAFIDVQTKPKIKHQ